jgi:hypothetical protein
MEVLALQNKKELESIGLGVDVLMHMLQIPSLKKQVAYLQQCYRINLKYIDFEVLTWSMRKLMFMASSCIFSEVGHNYFDKLVRGNGTFIKQKDSGPGAELRIYHQYNQKDITLKWRY